MFRALSAIVAAIALSQPGLPRQTAERFATAIQREAVARGFDPFTAVAIIHFESSWVEDVISPNGEDYGLGQIRARFVGACRKDKSPKDAPSPECQAVKDALLSAERNIEAMGALIEHNRKVCREKARSTAFPRWLASYQGRNYPKQGRWCVPGKDTWKVIRFQQWLTQKLGG